jgi:hypothetical protein
VSFRTFSFFVRFIRDICEICNDPAFSNSNYNQSTASKTRPSVISLRLDIASNNSNRCPLHKAGHTLNDCWWFRKCSLQDRQKFRRENRICFKCCESNEHIAKIGNKFSKLYEFFCYYKETVYALVTLRTLFYLVVFIYQQLYVMFWFQYCQASLMLYCFLFCSITCIFAYSLSL